MAAIRALALCLGALWIATPAAAQVAAKKTADPGFLGGKWYGTFEVRHHINTYYQTDGYLARQEPSLHARLQLGAQFYEGLADAYVTLGAFKVPQTQQIMQRRPELALDLYPVRGDYFTLQQYNLIQLPVKENDTIPMNEDERVDHGVDQGTIITLGLSPTANYATTGSLGRLEVKGGLDGWTRFFSRKQYTEDYLVPQDEDDDGSFSLVPATNEEPIEDTAAHYRSQVFAGVGGSFGSVKEFQSEVSAHYQSRFDPRYTRSEDGSVDYVYEPTRYSYYQIRLRYEFSERVALTNDFYNFFDGAFQGKREGDDRRFRNVARVSCKL